MSSLWSLLFPSMGAPTIAPPAPGGGRRAPEADQGGVPWWAQGPAPGDAYTPSPEAQLGILELQTGQDLNGDGAIGTAPPDEAGDPPPADETGDPPPADETGDPPPADETGDPPPADETGDPPPADETGDPPPAGDAEELTPEEYLASLKDNTDELDAADGTSDDSITQAGLWAYGDQDGVSAEDQAAANYFGDNFDTLDPDGDGSVNTAGFLNGDLADQLEEAKPTSSEAINSDQEALYHLSTVEDLSSAQDENGDPLFSADDLDALSRGQGRFEDATEQQQAAATYVQENDDLEASLDATNTDGAMDPDEADREDDWYSTGALKQPKAVAENKETLAEPKEDPPAGGDEEK